MGVHRSVLGLARGLALYLPLPALAAAAAYLATLAPHVYPGRSARLVSAAAGLTPPSEAAHPLFAFLARAGAAADALPLPLRMNLLSALCGIGCAALLYHLVARTILFAACEDAGGSRVDLAPAGEAPAKAAATSPLPPEVEEYNRRMFRIAVIGGMVAAYALIFTAAGWTASTRLDPALFHLLLALCAICLFPFGRSRGHYGRTFLASLIFLIGVFESAVFILLLPIFLYLIFKRTLSSSRRKLSGALMILALLLAATLSVVLYRQNLAPSLQPSSVPAVMKSYLFALTSHHLNQLTALFPRRGWIQLLLQTALPASVMLFALQTLFREKRAATVAAIGLLTIAAVPALLDLPFAPLSLLRLALPSFSYAIIAAAAGFALSAALILFTKDTALEEGEKESSIDTSRQRSLKRLRSAAAAVLPLLTAGLLIAPWRGYRKAAPDDGAFADAIARLILDSMQSRTLLITNGILDDHLRIQALAGGKELTLIPLDPNPDSTLRTALRRLLETDPLFEGLNRTRLRNALSIGTVQFALEWIRSDAAASRKAMIFATPELWTTGGYHPVPEGLAFGGVKALDALAPEALFRQSASFTKNIIPLLDGKSDAQTQSAYIRKLLRTRAGFAVNELGVLLEELNRADLAYGVYEQASRIDPENVSAAINRYTLNLKQDFQPEMLDIMRKKSRAALERAKRNNATALAILQQHGTVRQSDFYLQQTAMWSRRGVKSVSHAKMQQALSLAERTGIDALKANALVYLHSGNTPQAEECYLAVLESAPDDVPSLKGLCSIMINRPDPVKAAQWLQAALDSGIDIAKMRYEQIAIELLHNNKDRALELLANATKEEPQDLRLWTMLCDILLELGDTQLVEHKIIPDIQRVLNTADHFMLYAIQGQLLRTKGPEFYREARLSYLRALSLNAALPEIWTAVFELDMIIGNPAFKESDARNLLHIDPDHPLANYIMGSSLLERGMLVESEDFLRRSIENRATAMACNDLAENLRMQKKLEEAETFARRARTLDPQLTPAMDTLACVLYDLGRFEEAAQAASQAVAARPGHAAYERTLLRAQAKTGDRQGAADGGEKTP
jgi:tetratricopeptide (TPR) repeat protein